MTYPFRISAVLFILLFGSVLLVVAQSKTIANSYETTLLPGSSGGAV